LSAGDRDDRVTAQRKTCRADAFAVDAPAEERIGEQLIQQDGQIAGALPEKQEALRGRLFFRCGVAMMVDGRDDVAARRQVISQPHHLNGRASGAVRQQHERELLFRVGDLCAGRDRDGREDLSVGWTAEDRFFFYVCRACRVPDCRSQRARRRALPVPAMLVSEVASDHADFEYGLGGCRAGEQED
jgi:hypothetical protein